MLKTKFWRNAYASLPEGVRARYLADIEQVERIELALGAAIEAARRALKNHRLASSSELNPTPTSSSSG